MQVQYITELKQTLHQYKALKWSPRIKLYEYF